MRRDLELRLFAAVRDGRKPRDEIGAMLADGSIKSAKQAWRTLEKWCAKGLYEFGVSLDLGWLTSKGAAK